MITPLRSADLAHLLPVRHGFFTRAGGVSDGIYATLNCGFGSADAAADVTANRALVAAWFGVGPDRLMICRQVHSPHVILVTEATGPWLSPAMAPEADAMVTRAPGIALGILTADCVPILLADAAAGVAGAAHAGWKGARDGVIAATVAAMAALGAVPAHITAAIGPAIRQPSYEVGPEFPGHFPAHPQRFVPAARTGHFLFDLPGAVRDQLAAAGVGRIDDLGHDTAAEPELFFSNRRGVLAGERDYGRLVSAIMLT